MDSSLALLREGYKFVGNRCHQRSTDVFKTRLLLRPTICMLGEAAARLFYDNQRFVRDGAQPSRLRKALIGRGAVQSLDGSAHWERKQLFMQLMTPQRIAVLAALSMQQWKLAIPQWQRCQQIVLLAEVQKLLCRAVCAWTGVPLPEAEVDKRSADLAALIDGAGHLGPRYWKARAARWRTERWVMSLVHAVRGGCLMVNADTALAVMARYRVGSTRLHLSSSSFPHLPQVTSARPGTATTTGPSNSAAQVDKTAAHAQASAAQQGLLQSTKRSSIEAGALLPAHTVAVELINLLRPTVAIARFVAFAALALHEYPQWRERVARSEEEARWFVQEVRRFYPFFPLVAARARIDFEWHGVRFKRGERVMLDIYGTNHDPRVWAEPNKFCPERFRHWNRSPFNFVAQGGGDHFSNHRCAGEWVTIELMQVAVHALSHLMDYALPAQDLTVRLDQMPTQPTSGVVLAAVRPR